MRITGIAAAFAAGTSIVALAAPLQAQTIAYTIPAGDLKAALDIFGKQSSRPIIYRADDIRGVTVPGYRGTASPDQALRELLAGTGFSFRAGEAGSFAVFRLGNDRQGGVDGDIVVTAQKKAERLADIPQSITAVSGATLQNMSATQFRDFADTVPGLSYQSAGAGQSQLTLRGVTVGADISPTVGIYIDDVAFGSTTNFARSATLALDLGLFDLDRIEVLRGPQGTLYGASTMGGLIKYVSSKPDSTRTSLDAQAGISTTRYGGINYNGAAAANLPLAEDKAALRVTGYYSHDGGYIDNIARGEKDVNRSRVYGTRGDLLLTPTEALSIRIGGYFQNIDRDGIATADFDRTGRSINGALVQDRPFSEPFEQRFRLVSGSIDYDLGFASLTSITSYQTANTRYRVDYTPGYQAFLAAFGLGTYSGIANNNHLRTKKFTQELRLASGSSDSFEWIVGAYYDLERSRNNQALETLDLTGTEVPNNLFTFYVPSRYEEIAGFGNATLHITPRFDVSGGIRYASMHQRTEQFGSGVLGSVAPRRTSTDKVPTYLVNARYRPSRLTTAYLRYATSYRPGGPNFITNDPATGLPFGPTSFDADKLRSYEVGFRSETKDRTFSIDLSAYYIDWNNLQIVAAVNGFGVLTNAEGGASIRGAEATLTARPTRGFVVTGAFAYQHGRMDEANADLGAARHERLPNVPRYTAAITADYEFGLSDLRPSLGATLRYVSDRTTSFNASVSSPQYRLPAYPRVDLRAAIMVQAVKAQIYVHNLFDTRGQLLQPTFGSNFDGPFQSTILQPRTIGLTLSTKM